MDLFISSERSSCSTKAFPPLGNSDHVVVTVSLDFPSNSEQDALFHCIADDCSCADWDGLCYNLKDVPRETIFKLSASAAANKFYEWVQVENDVYILHRKYQSVRSSLTYLHCLQLLVLLPWFTEMTFFVCTNKIL